MSARCGSAGEAAYAVVDGWPHLPEGEALGKVTGVAVDSHDHVFVFHRAGREWSDPMPETPIAAEPIWVFDGRTGALLSRWGATFFVMPHGLTIDARDNVWVTDVALHQVFRFSHDGALQRTFGEARRPGADPTHFDLPTDIAPLPDGRFYVSDGYGNARVVRFDADGRYAGEWGARGSASGELDLPHGIAADEDGRLYVADRSNARIQVFDASGTFLAQWQSDALGIPYDVAVKGECVYVVDGTPHRSRVIVLDRAGNITATFGRFVLAHAIAVGADGAVYVGDLEANRVQKFVPHT